MRRRSWRSCRKRRRSCGRRCGASDGEPGAIQQVQQAAEELQRTADEAAGPNPAPRGVQRVQIEEPAINVREYLIVGIGERPRLRRPGGAGALLRLLPAGVGRSVQAQAGEAGRARRSRRRRSRCRSSTRSTRRSSASCSCASSRASSSASRPGSRSGMVGLEQAGVWGIAAGVFNSIPVLRTGDRRGRHGRRRVPAVRHDRDGALRRRASRWPSPASKAGC